MRSCSILSGSMLKVSFSMSAKTGRAPVNRIELAEAMNVKGEVMTSSPSPIPCASRAMCRAAVPELTATAYLVPMNLAKASSSSSTFLPWARMPDFNTAVTALISSSPMTGLAMGIIVSSLAEERAGTQAEFVELIGFVEFIEFVEFVELLEFIEFVELIELVEIATSFTR